MSSNKPQIVNVSSAEAIKDAVTRLELNALPVILLLGNVDERFRSQIRSICGRVIAPIAIDPGAIILDIGNSGCAAVMGAAALEQEQMPDLLSVVSNDTAETALDANHTVFVRVPKDWLDSAKHIFQIVEQVANRGNDGLQPVSTVLFGGGDFEKTAIVRCARKGWPVIVIEKTGGLADEILDSHAPATADPDLREIVDTASLYRFPMDGNLEDLKRILLGRVDLRKEAVTNTLKEAWAVFDQLDETANAKQKLFRRVELSILVLAVAATLFAVLQAGKSVPHWFGLHTTSIHLLVLIIPITASIIAAYNSYFREGYKWVLLRGAAEAIRREIFRFRARAGVYSDEQCIQNSRESKLAAKIKDITSALEQSEVNKTVIEGPIKSDVSRLQFLSPDEYREVRLQDQLGYFSGRIRKLSRRLRLMQTSAYIAGAAGTFLAAINLDVWVALATSFVTALTTKLQADQVENSLVRLNQSLMSVRNVELWWNALSRWEKGRRTNIDLLVDQTEKALEGETAGWVQQMQSALDRMTEKEHPANSEQRSSSSSQAVATAARA